MFLKKYIYNLGRNRYIKSIKECRNRLLLEQLELEISFNFEEWEKIHINVWDEFDENKTTFLKIEDSEIPNKICADILIFLLNELRNNKIIKNTEMAFNMKYYDSFNEFPELADWRIPLGYQYWKIEISNPSESGINLIIDELKSIRYKNVSLVIYSES